MTSQFEIEYGRAWQKLAWEEGHRKVWPKAPRDNAALYAAGKKGGSSRVRDAKFNRANIFRELTTERQQMKQIAEKLNLTSSTVSRHVNAMVGAGVAKRDGHGACKV